MLDALMPKAATFVAALVSGIGAVATSAPEITGGTDSGGIPLAGWTGLVLGGFSVLIAISGTVMSFLDKRKVAEADTNLAVIENQEKTIEYLKGQNEFLRKQIVSLEANEEKTRKRAHDIADFYHAKLLDREAKVATLTAYMKGSGLEVPEFPNSPDQPPVFPDTIKNE